MDHEITAYTFAVQHNPNCPSPWLVRMPGRSCVIDMKPYHGFGISPQDMTGDILSFGKSFEEAANGALRQHSDAMRKGGE